PRLLPRWREPAAVAGSPDRAGAGGGATPPQPEVHGRERAPSPAAAQRGMARRGGLRTLGRAAVGDGGRVAARPRHEGRDRSERLRTPTLPPAGPFSAAFRGAWRGACLRPGSRMRGRRPRNRRPRPRGTAARRGGAERVASAPAHAYPGGGGVDR